MDGIAILGVALATFTEPPGGGINGRVTRQEQGLDVEDMRVQTLERMRRLFLLVLAAAQFVFYLIDTWPAAAVQWIRYLGGKLGLDNDLDGPYLVLRGLAALFQTVATLTFASLLPFPHHLFTYG